MSVPLLAALVLLAEPTLSPPPPAPAAAAEAPIAAESVSPDLAFGRRVNLLAMSGDAETLAPMLSAPFLQAIGGSSGLQAMSGSITSQLGNEVEVKDESVLTLNGATTYQKLSRFERGPDMITRWVWTADHVVQGGAVRPAPAAAATDRLDYATRAALHLPFAAPEAGESWFVFWGGRDVLNNYHVVDAGQRFAYDFMVVKDAMSHAGEGRENADYYCWGRAVVAPAAGTVTEAVGDIADNAIGTTNTTAPAGNHVVIDHGDGEYSLIAHLRQGSMSVHVGDHVTARQQIGVCGNSGNSSEPHVHYHLQSAATFGQGVGLPAQFIDYRADGEAVTRDEPRRGQRIVP